MKKSGQLWIVVLLTLVLLALPLPGVRYPAAEAAAGADPLERLRGDFDRIFSNAKFAGAHWGIQVYSLDRSESLYERNPSLLFVPASNTKIITSVVTLLRLGPDYVFHTLLMTDGAVADGVLKGNLYVIGFGDPSITVETPDEDPLETFRQWSSILKAKGIRKISGDIVGDGSSFERTTLGQGWAWDDLSEGYAAPVTALQFNGNRLWLEITPGRKIGESPTIRIKPLPTYWIVENQLTTTTRDAEAKIEIERRQTDESIVVRGNVPVNGVQKTRAVAVYDPTRYYLSALKHALADENIDVLACGIRETGGTDPESLSLLWTSISPPLSEILKPLLKESLNLYAETLTRALGLELNGSGSFSAGREIVEETLSRMAIDKNQYSYADGSGLSRQNLVSVKMLVRILRSIYRHRYFADFYDALAIAGMDGTLENRLKGSKAENNVRAKTGSLSNVSSISGYVKTMDGEMLAFSMIANNFLLPKSEADAAQDEVLKKLAGFSRKQ